MYGVSLLVFAGFCLMAHAEIYDPMNIFCGSLNCYDILNLNRSSSFQEIRKSFRQLSLTKHPDKSKNDNATEVYRLITKAYKVVGTNESRVLFDYYLDHPRDYFKVSGHHYVKAVPKSNVFVVVLGALLLISWFFHVVQYQRWEKASTYLKHATLNNLALKNGGTKETAAMYNQAVAKYEDHCAKMKITGKNASKLKMAKDPLFKELVDKIVDEMKMDDDHKKPGLNDLLIVRLFMFPYWLYTFILSLSTKDKPLESKKKSQ